MSSTEATSSRAPDPTSEKPAVDELEGEGAQLLAQARGAFHKGAYQSARAFAARAQTSGSPRVQKDAELLLSQLSPAPLIKYLLLLTFFLLIVVTFLAYRG